MKTILLFLFCITSLHAQTSEEDCPRLKELNGLCLHIANGTANIKGGKGIEDAYQRQIMDAACVDIENDSEEEKIRKISSMWAKFQGEKDFFCDNYQFDIPNGSVIKFAIVSKFDDFIYDIIDWKIDLNQVDESDGNHYRK